ncbi:MAG: DUF5717 family protein, partial [Lachnospiraceae bacterium]|nr:DUF5717 family protein [Lachnospiraceae bacterium]
MEQKEEVTQDIAKQYSQERPKILLSDSYLNLTIEAGKTYYGSFTVRSGNGIDLCGKVISTNDKVVLENHELSGTECSLPFYFKGKLATSGEEHFGDFLLLSNGGEKNLPYCITVVPKKFWIGERPIGTLEDFSSFAEENWKTAREAFFTKEFKEVFITENQDSLFLYQGLLKGRSRDVILDNFLQATTGKKPVTLEPDCSSLRLKDKKQAEVCFLKKGWGCCEGKIYSRNHHLRISQESFGAADFQENKLSVPVSFQEQDGFCEDILVVETVFQRIEVPVVFVPQRTEKSQEMRQPRERTMAKLLKNYVDL